MTLILVILVILVLFGGIPHLIGYRAGTVAGRRMRQPRDAKGRFVAR